MSENVIQINGESFCILFWRLIHSSDAALASELMSSSHIRLSKLAERRQRAGAMNVSTKNSMETGERQSAKL